MVSERAVQETKGCFHRKITVYIALFCIIAIGSLATGIALLVTRKSTPEAPSKTDPHSQTEEPASSNTSSITLDPSYPTAHVSEQPQAKPVATMSPASAAMQIAEETILSALDPVLPVSSSFLLSVPGTCQSFALKWLVSNSNDNLSASRVRQRYALVVLYCELDGENWIRKGHWLTENHECDWFTDGNILCGLSEQVQIVRLVKNNLTGTIPPDVALLSDLWALTLSRNPGLNGPVPGSLERLSELDTLDLSHNQLQGEVGHMFRFYDMARLDLSHNQFTNGDLNFDLMPNVESIRLNDNQLQGTLSIPYFPSYLEELQLHQNQYTSGSLDEFCPLLQHNLHRMTADLIVIQCACCTTSYLSEFAPSPSLRESASPSVDRCYGNMYDGRFCQSSMPSLTEAPVVRARGR